MSALVFGLFMSCTRQRNEANDTQNESLENYSFICDKSLRDSLVSFINNKSDGQFFDSNKITVLTHAEDGVVEISFFKMNTFAYPIKKSSFLGAPTVNGDNIIIFYTGIIPSVLDTNFINYTKGLELLGEETLRYLWDGVRHGGYWKKYSRSLDNSWQIIDLGNID